MRVLQINSVAESGSTGRIVRAISSGLTSHGHEPWVAYGRGGVSEAENQVRVGTAFDVLSHVGVSRLLDAHGLGSRRATHELRRTITTLAPDIVHLHNVHGYYVNYPLLLDALARWGGPVVWTLHDCWAFTGHCAYFDFVECDKWLTGCGSCPQLRSYPQALLVDRSKRNHRAKETATSGLNDLTLVTPSRWLRDLVKSSFLGHHPCVVIPNDPDLDTFVPTASNWRTTLGLEGRFVLLGVANVWERRKGLDTLLTLADELRNDETLVLVGPVPKSVRLPPSVVALTRTDNGQDLAGLYTAADLFLNPTLEDNYPTTNLEALGCGTPVITFDTGGAPETVQRGSGMTITDRTAAGMRRAVDEWRSSSTPTVSASLLRNDGAGMVARYLALYDSAVAGRDRH